MTTATLPTQPSFLKKQLFRGVTISTVLIVAITLFAFGLHMLNIQSIGNANEYYTAAVKSMLQSWSNFFFVAAEPGGSVTVDKPPLGLWIEALFAYFLGVSGFSVSLPNILAGVFGIPLLYSMVKKYMGEFAGLVAAFVMAITPVFVATNRNNTMDGLLVFFLLAAAWAFIQATEKGQLRWLLLGAFIVGMGFNIKMMQAFLPLPAFYALYFFGSRQGWGRKIFNLGLASVLLLVVSLAWAVAVDLVPADQRPFIGSTHDNSVMELIIGHNGISRLGSMGGPGSGPQNGGPQAGSNPNPGLQPQSGNRQGPPAEALAACVNSTQGADCSFTQPGHTVQGICIIPPNSSALACAPQGMIPLGQQPIQQMMSGGPGRGGGTQFSQETGEPGIFRFFSSSLSKQMSWLLPFALISVLLALFPVSSRGRFQLPLETGAHKALLLWGGWLLTCVVFFSAVSGIFHAYYAIMLAPALGAMVGIGFASLWNWRSAGKWSGVVLVLSAALTIGYQLFASAQYGELAGWMAGIGVLFGLGLLLMFFRPRAAYVTLLAAMLVMPLYWTGMTVATNGNQKLPTAYAGVNQQQGRFAPVGQPAGQNPPESNVNQDLLAYLLANTQDVKYLVAVPSSQQGSGFVIETGRPVLYMGGFSGGDQVVDAQDLSALVAQGDLRYVYYGENGNGEITSWLRSACSVVPEFSRTSTGNGNSAGQSRNGPQGPKNEPTTLYQCK